MPPTDPYATDLAAVHDSGFTGLAEQAATRILELLSARGVDSGMVVELGSGPGRTARRLTDAGYDVLGFDLSPAMVALARETAPAARFEARSFLEVDLPPCEAVIAVGEVFNYRFDRSHREEALAGFFGSVRAALSTNGILVFDVAGPGRVPAGGPTRSQFGGEEWAVLMEAEETKLGPGRAELVRRITTFRREREDLYRRSHETHRLRLLSPALVLDLLRGAGFRARVLRGYDGEPFAPGHRVYVARPGR